MLIPRRIRSGYNNRDDTYIGKLAYVIYYDETNKIRKETSWNSWRNKDIPPDEYTNEPTEGFVLNKKVGGTSWSSWNTRATYIRVYDPRGFEFEISIQNLLFILENTNSIRGKGLEGEFVYGWEGKELWLIPVDAPEYKGWVKYANTLFNSETVKAKDLVAGYTYSTKQGDEWIYLGRFIDYIGKPTKKYWFIDVDYTAGSNKCKYYTYTKFNRMLPETITSVPSKIIECTQDSIHPEYADIMDALEHTKRYVGFDTIDKYIPYTLEEFKKYCEPMMEGLGRKYFYLISGCERWCSWDANSNKITVYKGGDRYRDIVSEFDTVEELFNDMSPHYQNIYLSNGKMCGTTRGWDVSLKEIMEEENE